MTGGYFITQYIFTSFHELFSINRMCNIFTGGDTLRIYGYFQIRISFLFICCCFSCQNKHKKFDFLHCIRSTAKNAFKFFLLFSKYHSYLHCSDIHIILKNCDLKIILGPIVHCALQKFQKDLLSSALICLPFLPLDCVGIASSSSVQNRNNHKRSVTDL